MDIGENIRKLREEAGYTQKQLAGIIGIKGSYLSALERGKRRPGNKILPLLCDALAVDKWTILYGTRERPDRVLSSEEEAMLAAIKGLPKDVVRVLTQIIMKLKHPAKEFDSLTLRNPFMMVCPGKPFIPLIRKGCGRTSQGGKQLQM